MATKEFSKEGKAEEEEEEPTSTFRVNISSSL
jgi:hypothetical protein